MGVQSDVRRLDIHRPIIAQVLKPGESEECTETIDHWPPTTREYRPVASDQLFVYALLPGRVDHRFDIFRFGLIKERPIAHDQTATFTSGINELLDVIFYFLRRA